MTLGPNLHQVWVDPRGDLYQPVCNCGWKGEPVERAQTALDAGHAHRLEAFREKS